jgi:hypothetical protein
MSKVFRDKFMAALALAHKNGEIERAPQGEGAHWCIRQEQLYKHNWVVSAKTPLHWEVRPRCWST